MIDFNNKGYFARLRRVRDNEFDSILNGVLISGEKVIGAYKSIRDGVVFTDKRIIAINVQGVTGKKRDLTSIPYSKITTYSLESAGTFDLDAELEIYMSAVGKVKFEFTGNTNVDYISQLISLHALT